MYLKSPVKCNSAKKKIFADTKQFFPIFLERQIKEDVFRLKSTYRLRRKNLNAVAKKFRRLQAPTGGLTRPLVETSNFVRKLLIDNNNKNSIHFSFQETNLLQLLMERSRHDEKAAELVAKLANGEGDTADKCFLVDILCRELVRQCGKYVFLKISIIGSLHFFPRIGQKQKTSRNK